MQAVSSVIQQSNEGDGPSIEDSVPWVIAEEAQQGDFRQYRGFDGHMIMTQKNKLKATSQNRSQIAAFGNGPFLARLSSRSALVSELKILLAVGSDEPQDGEYRHLILNENCLAKATESSRRRAWEDLSSRYLLRPSHPLFRSFLAEWSRHLTEPEMSLTLYCLWALNDKLVAELGISYLFPKLREAPSAISADDISSYLFAEQSRHPELLEWSSKTTAAVTRKYVASIRDFGLAKGVYSKMSVRPALYAAPARLLVRALRLHNTNDLRIVHSPWFRLIGLDSHEVIDAFGELSRQGKLGFRMQADVVELDLEGRQS